VHVVELSAEDVFCVFILPMRRNLLIVFNTITVGVTDWSQMHVNIFAGNVRDIWDESLIDLEHVLVGDAASGKHNVSGDLVTANFSSKGSWIDLILFFQLF